MKLTPAQICERRKKANATAQKKAARMPIETIGELVSLVNQKRSVFCKNSWGLLPAVVVLNMPAVVVINAIKRKELYFYPFSSYEATRL